MTNILSNLLLQHRSLALEKLDRSQSLAINTDIDTFQEMHSIRSEFLSQSSTICMSLIQHSFNAKIN